jgi:hypothetical protein
MRAGTHAKRGLTMATVSVGDGSWGSTGAGSRSRGRTWIKVLAAVAVGAGAAWWYYGSGEPVAATGAVGNSVRHSANSKTTVEGVAAIARCREMLAAAKTKLAGVPTMSAVFHKQERIDGKLQSVNVMDLKVRHAPLSIYMKWQSPDPGQQLIWREGRHEGKILVSPVGWKKKVMPLAKLDPTGEMALSFSRRPVNNAGVWTFAERLAALVDEELTRDPAVQVKMSEGDEISGRPCALFTFEHPQPSLIVPFQKVSIYIDQVLGVPVSCEHYRYHDAGGKPEPQLEESYLFSDLVLGVDLSDADFDHENPSLQFGLK